MARYKIDETDYRNWGSYTVTDVEYKDSNCVKCEKDITIKPGFMLSVQSHDKRKENWKVTSGTLTVILNGNVITLQAGEEIDIPLKAVHTMANLGTTSCIVQETQEGVCSEGDIHRYWDPNGREIEDSQDESVLSSIKTCEQIMSDLEELQKKLI